MHTVTYLELEASDAEWTVGVDMLTWCTVFFSGRQTYMWHSANQYTATK